MQVKCLNQEEKQFIKEHYELKTMRQKELAEFFAVSERTINRVLTELGLATPVARVKGEAYRAMKLLEKHRMSVEELEEILERIHSGNVKASAGAYA